LGPARIAGVAETYGDLTRATLGLALCGAGKLDEAAALVGPAPAETASPASQAMLVRVRALVALEKGLADEALAEIAANRALIRNAMAGGDRALMGAIEALAMAKSGQVYRGGAASPEPVLADDRERAFVTAILPEAASALTPDP